ncbi:hypothetical protein [Glaciihabitans sp. dw_435]|uniref:hypothetical protein n=1 Tax=Glaciihabitans sp. dw_435 TaxID=2720081 RepID=UPI001BD5CFD4|nr:hypothetical protein [Glaciihabitans sp. dw_435]
MVDQDSYAGDGPDLLGLADRFWRWQDVLAGVTPPARPGSSAAVDTDTALDVGDELDAVLATSDRDDLLLAIIQARGNDTTDLEALGAGVVDDIIHGGDPDVLARMRHYGVAGPVVAAIARAASD